MDSDTRREIVLGTLALERLREVLVNKGWPHVHIRRIVTPFLVVPVLHLRGVRIMVHVQLGRAGPDLYVWDRGHRRYPTRDVCGAARQLLTDARTGSGGE